jgi:nicotinamide riboside kinase
MSSAIVIALLGAESTGKTTLSQALAQALHSATGLRCAVVDEYLRTWCEQQQRTPRGDEQRTIAHVQHQRIAQAAATHDVVIADTTAVMTAVYSRFVWADASLDAWAAELHARTVHATLLTALDLPWVSDGLQREGPQVRAPVDALVRELLATGNIAWSRISGVGPVRLEQALNAVTPMFSTPTQNNGLFTRLAQRDAAMPAWQTACELCDDPQCEHRLLRANTPNTSA